MLKLQALAITIAMTTRMIRDTILLLRALSMSIKGLFYQIYSFKIKKPQISLRLFGGS
jgi:hypothetical protein